MDQSVPLRILHDATLLAVHPPTVSIETIDSKLYHGTCILVHDSMNITLSDVSVVTLKGGERLDPYHREEVVIPGYSIRYVLLPVELQAQYKEVCKIAVKAYQGRRKDHMEGKRVRKEEKMKQSTAEKKQVIKGKQVAAMLGAVGGVARGTRGGQRGRVGRGGGGHGRGGGRGKT